jgi:hypothetical protein
MHGIASHCTYCTHARTASHRTHGIALARYRASYRIARARIARISTHYRDSIASHRECTYARNARTAPTSIASCTHQHASVRIASKQCTYHASDKPHRTSASARTQHRDAHRGQTASWYKTYRIGIKIYCKMRTIPHRIGTASHRHQYRISSGISIIARTASHGIAASVHRTYRTASVSYRIASKIASHRIASYAPHVLGIVHRASASRIARIARTYVPVSHAPGIASHRHVSHARTHRTSAFYRHGRCITASQSHRIKRIAHRIAPVSHCIAYHAASHCISIAHRIASHASHARASHRISTHQHAHRIASAYTHRIVKRIARIASHQ